VAEEQERIFVVPLREVKHSPNPMKSKVAMGKIRSYMSRCMKVDEGHIWIAESVNRFIWKNGAKGIPSKIRLKTIKFEDGQVEISLPGEKVSSRKEEPKRKLLGRRMEKKEKEEEKEAKPEEIVGLEEPEAEKRDLLQEGEALKKEPPVEEKKQKESKEKLSEKAKEKTKKEAEKKPPAKPQAKPQAKPGERKKSPKGKTKTGKPKETAKLTKQETAEKSVKKGTKKKA
jgi:large subunit ribosomal protein L31e